MKRLCSAYEDMTSTKPARGPMIHIAMVGLQVEQGLERTLTSIYQGCGIL
ncbi:hypothetical protein DM02DRAFT_665494 [Periconia macrospinosa]|uniref:Uncharacterized protein n=1 Tax=Periconia macrospinosa TaxID=97972 RepID=A0A2V1CWM9_9PLEO|nr:hypothetical protein DM02DRAFT_665494 [Periconia macrospinosa]